MKAKYKMEAKHDTCHHLYTMQAFKHLHAAVRCLRKLADFSNLDVDELWLALFNAAQKLIYTNPAYKEAFDVLCEMYPKRYTFLRLEKEKKSIED